MAHDGAGWFAQLKDGNLASKVLDAIDGFNQSDKFEEKLLASQLNLSALVQLHSEKIMQWACKLGLTDASSGNFPSNGLSGEQVRIALTQSSIESLVGNQREELLDSTTHRIVQIFATLYMIWTFVGFGSTLKELKSWWHLLHDFATKKERSLFTDAQRDALHFLCETQGKPTVNAVLTQLDNHGVALLPFFRHSRTAGHAVYLVVQTTKDQDEVVAMLCNAGAVRTDHRLQDFSTVPLLCMRKEKLQTFLQDNPCTPTQTNDYSLEYIFQSLSGNLKEGSRSQYALIIGTQTIGNCGWYNLVYALSLVRTWDAVKSFDYDKLVQAARGSFVDRIMFNLAFTEKIQPQHSCIHIKFDRATIEVPLPRSYLSCTRDEATERSRSLCDDCFVCKQSGS